MNEMNFEVYPEGIYSVIKQFSKYNIDNIIITENGVCYKDFIQNGKIHDHERIAFFKAYLAQSPESKRRRSSRNGILCVESYR